MQRQVDRALVAHYLDHHALAGAARLAQRRQQLASVAYVLVSDRGDAIADRQLGGGGDAVIADLCDLRVIELDTEPGLDHELRVDASSAPGPGAFDTLARQQVVQVGDAAGDDAADKVIADRLWGSAFLAVLQELDEAIATPADIDMGAGLALRFGKAPCAAMDGFGRDEVARLIGYYCDAYDVAVPKSLERVGSLVG